MLVDDTNSKILHVNFNMIILKIYTFWYKLKLVQECIEK